ncbi:cytochrome P450 [Bisporella sp. PMI_857]|nr:cytochrome P450 [Bisporella sp. PMI_857]
MPLGLLAYIAGVAIYRLYFSPIAHIPGPKLAALTQWYEAYYNLYLDGQFTFHITKLHKIYGPVIRINPWEVHINDPEYFDTIYSAKPFSKVKWHSTWNMSPKSSLSTIEHSHHRARRAAFNPFFSKLAINRFAPEIQARASALCKKINLDFSGRTMNLGLALGGFATDVILEYCFATDFNCLDAKDFDAPFPKAIEALSSKSHFTMHFPWIANSLTKLPDWLMNTLNPGLASFSNFQKDMNLQIKGTMTNSTYTSKRTTIFQEILASNTLPAQEKTLSRLQDEGVTLVGAGIHTVRWSVSLMCFYILSEPEIFQHLREELDVVWPDIENPPTLKELEQLPYLTAIIQEGLRLSNGVASRSPRTAHQHLWYKSFKIPSGTPVSLTFYHIHQNETIFPSPEIFIPNRWLPDRVTGEMPVGPIDKKLLTRYLVGFGRGTRQCAGLNLAYAEIYILLANLFRCCEMELFETSERDVRFYRDHVVAAARPESSGLRVFIKEA